MTINSLLADQLKALNLTPAKLAPSPGAQKPRCLCHNKYLTDCPKPDKSYSKVLKVVPTEVKPASVTRIRKVVVIKAS